MVAATAAIFAERKTLPPQGRVCRLNDLYRLNDLFRTPNLILPAITPPTSMTSRMKIITYCS